jgi:hypothetical protein
MNDDRITSRVIDVRESAALKDRWLQVALAHAGINPAHWQPQRGVQANRTTIEAVYAYYGRLFLDDPRYRWAGMAAMVGPSFYAGFLDLGALPDALRRLAASSRRWGLRVARGAVDDEVREGSLGFDEFTFLTMQRKIFEDQAVMHEAHRGGGIEAIRALEKTGMLDTATSTAWEEIDRAAPGELDAGNLTLLWREQYTIIDRFYRRMRSYHPPAGAALTYSMTLAGWPSIPGAKGFEAVFPLTLDAPLPPLGWRRHLVLRTPLTGGNVAVFADRWALLEADTFPAYLRFLREEPEQARAILATPVRDRVRRWRITRRLPALIRATLRDWSLTVQPARRGALARPPAEQTIDLRSPGAFGLRAVGGVLLASRDPGGAPLRMLLPAGDIFETSARLVLLRRDGQSAIPAQIVVKLPSVDAPESTALVARVAAALGLDLPRAAPLVAESEIGARRDGYSAWVAARSCLASWLLAEVQVEHHADEGRVVVDLLFSCLLRDGEADPSQRGSGLNNSGGDSN